MPGPANGESTTPSPTFTRPKTETPNTHPDAMKHVLPISLIMLFAVVTTPRHARAQASEHEAVLASLTAFFEGFADQDSTKMFRYMDRGARLVLTSYTPDGQSAMHVYGAEEFVGILMRPRQQPIKEVISNPEIRVVDNLAAVWVDYDFWVDDRIDHCGVDHFQLFRSTDGWKIVATADTRQRTPCAQIP